MSEQLPQPLEDDALESLLEGAALATYRQHLKSLAMVIRPNPAMAAALMPAYTAGLNEALALKNKHAKEAAAAGFAGAAGGSAAAGAGTASATENSARLSSVAPATALTAGADDWKDLEPGEHGFDQVVFPSYKAVTKYLKDQRAMFGDEGHPLQGRWTHQAGGSSGREFKVCCIASHTNCTKRDI